MKQKHKTRRQLFSGRPTSQSCGTTAIAAADGSTTPASSCRDIIHDSFCDTTLGRCACPLGTIYMSHVTACLPIGRALKTPFGLSLGGIGVGGAMSTIGPSGGFEVFKIPDPILPNLNSSKYGEPCLSQADCDPTHDVNLRCSLLSQRCVCWKYFNFDPQRQLCTFDRFCRWDNFTEQCHPYYNPVLYLIVVWLLAIICSVAMCWCPRLRPGTASTTSETERDPCAEVGSRHRASRAERRERIRARYRGHDLLDGLESSGRSQSLPVEQISGPIHPSDIITPEAEPPPPYEEAILMPAPARNKSTVINITSNYLVDMTQRHEEEVSTTEDDQEDYDTTRDRGRHTTTTNTMIVSVSTTGDPLSQQLHSHSNGAIETTSCHSIATQTGQQTATTLLQQNVDSTQNLSRKSSFYNQSSCSSK